jgi:hypothetical protein
MLRCLLAPLLHHPVITLEGHGPVYWTPIITAELYG